MSLPGEVRQPGASGSKAVFEERDTGFFATIEL
jgi:hypothetical protein